MGAKHAHQRVRNGCQGRIADMTVPEALRVNTDGGIKPDMAFLALLCECKPGMLPYFSVSARASFGFLLLSALFGGAFYLFLFTIFS